MVEIWGVSDTGDCELLIPRGGSWRRCQSQHGSCYKEWLVSTKIIRWYIAISKHQISTTKMGILWWYQVIHQNYRYIILVSAFFFCDNGVDNSPLKRLWRAHWVSHYHHPYVYPPTRASITGRWSCFKQSLVRPTSALQLMYCLITWSLEFTGHASYYYCSPSRTQTTKNVLTWNGEGRNHHDNIYIHILWTSLYY